MKAGPKASVGVGLAPGGGPDPGGLGTGLWCRNRRPFGLLAGESVLEAHRRRLVPVLLPPGFGGVVLLVGHAVPPLDSVTYSRVAAVQH